MTTIKEMKERQKSIGKGHTNTTFIMENYKISNQNSVYHLPKNSKEVCILDLKTRAFVSEKLVWASDA